MEAVSAQGVRSDQDDPLLQVRVSLQLLAQGVLMYVARTLKKRKPHYKGVKFPARWRSMTLGEQRAWYLGVDMTLADIKRMERAASDAR